jgi:membrane-associated phospholipid phosphatase
VGKILLVLVWFAGIGVILGLAALLASRARAASPGTPPNGAHPVGPAMASSAPSEPVLRTVARFLVFIVAGVAVVFAVMALLGLIVLHAGPAVDKPAYHWVISHRAHLWTHEMKNLTKIGDTWTTRAAAVTAAVCLAVTWSRMRWLPPVALGTLMVVHRGLTHAIHLVNGRIGPPGHLHGTFPSGGSERCVVFYGLIAYLIWREFSGRRRAAIWAGAVVACLAFNEGYSRIYLGMHWTTDVLSGWFYGLLLLVVFIAAVRYVAGPARVPSAMATGAPAVTRQAGTPAWDGPQQTTSEPIVARPGRTTAWKDQQ